MVELLYEAIARERSRLFVGRERELETVSRRLDDPRAPTEVVCVTGMGGVGKSTLLLRIEELGRSRGLATVWVDGRACGRTPSGFLAYLSSVLDRERRPPAAGDGIAGFVPRPSDRTLWCIDNFEELEPIDGWLRERFFAAFPSSGQLIVVASRQFLAERWRDDPGWKRRLRHFPLEPLSRSESREYLGRAGVPESAAEDLVRRTGGLPLALSLAVDAVERRPEAIDWSEKELVLTVNARLLRETAGSELQPLLDVLAVVSEADAGLLAEVTGERLPAERLSSLARLSFIHASRHGFRLHDVARQYLLADLRERDADRFRRVRRLAVVALLRRLHAAPPREAASVARALLAVCADALPSIEGYADLASLPSSTIRSAQFDDLARMHRLVEMWGDQPFVYRQPGGPHRMLERIVREFPEACRVLVAPGGALLGLFAAVLLWRETVRCIEAIEPGALARHFPREHRRMAALPPEGADTYVALVLGVDAENQEYSLQEITGALIRDGLARLGLGTRALLGAYIPQVSQLLTGLGFRKYQHGPADLTHMGKRCTLYELDLRSGRFGPWVMSFLDAVDGRPPAFAQAQAIAASDLRALLAGFNNPSSWERSPVPAALGVEPAALRARLNEVLSGAAPLPSPLAEEDREVLAQTFLHFRAPEAVAASLYVSRATYYRRLRRALDRLREALVGLVKPTSPAP